MSPTAAAGVSSCGPVVVVVLLLLLLLCEGTSGQGQGFIPITTVPNPKVNASGSFIGDLFCLFGGAGEWGCASTSCYSLAVKCLPGGTGQAWSSEYDPMPVGVSGGRFTAVHRGRAVLAVAGRYMVPEGDFGGGDHRELLLFDPKAESGSQWSRYPDVLPDVRTNVQVVGNNDFVYFLGGILAVNASVSRQMFRWSLLSPTDLEVLPEMPEEVVDPAVATNSASIFVVGGRSSSGEWSRGVWEFNTTAGVWVPLRDLPVTVPYVKLEVFGSHNIVTGSVWDSEFLLRYSFVPAEGKWVEAQIDMGTAHLGINFAVAGQQAHQGEPPRVYFFGGSNGTAAGTADSTVGYIKTGIAVPSYRVSPDSPVTGTTFNLTVEGIPPQPYYRIRVSNYSDCSAAVPWIQEVNFPEDSRPFVAVLQAVKPLPAAYVCFSLGTCPDPASPSASCYSQPPRGDPCPSGCCWDQSRRLCVLEVRGGPFLPLSQVPFTIIEAPPDSPHPLSPTRLTRETIYMWVVAGIFGLAIFFAGLVLRTCSRKPQPFAKADTPDTKYELVSKLGSGAYGVVYLVRRKADKTLLAMKYITCASDEEQEEAMKEFTVMRRFQRHPNMVKVLETTMNWVGGNDECKPEEATPLNRSAKGDTARSGSVEGLSIGTPRYVCLVMPYYPEGDLKSFVLAHHTLAFETVLNYIGQLASVLDYMHTSEPPLMHRDLKPENILMADNGTKLIVSDFGLARSIGASEYCKTQAGTLAYIAPECWERHYGTEVDIWALGCICYAIATRRVEPHTTRMMFTDVMRLGQKPFEKLLEADILGRGYPAVLVTLTCSLLQLDYRARPTASQLQETIGFASAPLTNPMKLRAGA